MSSYRTGVFIKYRYSIDSGGIRGLVFFSSSQRKAPNVFTARRESLRRLRRRYIITIAVVPRSRFTMVDVFCRRWRAVDALRLSVGGEEYRSTKKELSCVISYAIRPGRRKTRNRPRPRISARRKDGECRRREDASTHTHTATFILYVPRETNPPRSMVLTIIVKITVIISLPPQRYDNIIIIRPVNCTRVSCIIEERITLSLLKSLTWPKRRSAVQRRLQWYRGRQVDGSRSRV